ncbi:transcriptional regulator family: CP2 [Purpureocillium lilacinum]|uniref:Transcriptional regulator family: CP2 n=1 Tax=Purpureocillium lilacinum TaxID=33203 RepID=A0ABR0BDS7_PURLI|nr:transcriptional regulator family: CP2 [Purpureocillium lilacinum]
MRLKMVAVIPVPARCRRGCRLLLPPISAKRMPPTLSWLRPKPCNFRSRSAACGRPPTSSKDVQLPQHAHLPLARPPTSLPTAKEHLLFYLTLPSSFHQPTSLVSLSAVSTVARSRRLPVFPILAADRSNTCTRPLASKEAVASATLRHPLNDSSHRDRCSSTSATALSPTRGGDELVSPFLLSYESTFQSTRDLSGVSRERPCSASCYLSRADSYFRYRRSSQKPANGPLAKFQRQPWVGTVSTEVPGPGVAQAGLANHARIIYMPVHAERYAASSCGLLATRLVRTFRSTATADTNYAGQNVDKEPSTDQDPTQRASREPWRFIPSPPDPNSYTRDSLTNAPSEYYTPTSCGNNTLFHPQASDLHTPPLVMAHSLGMPPLMPTSGDGLQSGVTMMDMFGFQTPAHFDPFIQAPPPQRRPTSPSSVHQDKGYGSMEQEKFASVSIGQPLPASAEKFRFHATLNAPTAMIKHAHEIPVTYLNKGQAYSLSITDTRSIIPVQPGTKYRTCVRISFDDEERRREPSLYWGFWKERRGTDEAPQRGKPQAAGFVEASQGADGDDKRTLIKLETSSFDGFSVIWSPGLNGTAKVNLAVRFSVLSTDFSHSHGIKGILMRLCTKTTLVSPRSAPDTPPEICFCKVQLFRGGGGAERKLSDDNAHVNKSIDKLEQQLYLSESGTENPRKRKKRGGAAELQTLHDMLKSTRPDSVLSLRGDALDDPDLYPVAFPSNIPPLNRTDGAKYGPKSQPLSTKVLDVDPSYRPPPERDEQPVACFYVLHQTPMRPAYHRAIYLMKRTLEEFNGRIAQKWGLDVSKIARTLCVIEDGWEVEIDDDVVRELGEGQTMRLEVETTEQQRPSKRAKMPVDGLAEDDAAGGLVLRLRL